MHEAETHVRSENAGKRNGSLALALALFAISCAYITGEEGLLWLMWRDAPIAAAVLAAAAAFFAVRWWRTPRS
jgi:hypothetical protein